MKKIALTLLAALSFAAISASSQDDRIYIPSSDIMVGNNGIFVNIEGTVFKAHQISHDENGIYVHLENNYSHPEPLQACEKCGKAQKKKAEQNRIKKQEYLNKQKQEELEKQQQEQNNPETAEK